MTKDEIIEGIKGLFSDTSVSPDKTLEALEEIQEECLERIEAIRSDLNGPQE